MGDVSEDDLPPFLRQNRGGHTTSSHQQSDQEGDNTAAGSESHYQEAEDDLEGLRSSQRRDETYEARQSFWDGFKPSLMGGGRKKKKMKKNTTGKRGVLVFLFLLGLLFFVALQQLSAGGVQKITLLAGLFALPYIIVFFVWDLASYWNAEGGEHPWTISQRFNTVIGPAIISFAMSSCLFSAPLEGKVWIIGDKTTGASGTLYAIPVFSKITSITQEQEIAINVSGKTADGIIVNSRILTNVVCCADDPERILQLYGGSKARPDEVMKNYLIEIFDSSFKQAVGNVKVVEMRSAYASMAQNISKKRIREETALLWNGKFSVTDSRAELSVN